jgi:hypothetical protein
VKFALDLDGTMDRCPEFWRDFINNATNDQHRVYIVTCRPPTRENKDVILEFFEKYAISRNLGHVYFTSGQPKEQYMRELWGVYVDIWIDNDPATIVGGV